jgi:hypothetical protein
VANHPRCEGCSIHLATEFEKDGLVVLAVDVAESKKTVKVFLERNPRKAKVVLMADTNLAAMFAAKSFPKYVLINREGLSELDVLVLSRAAGEFQNEIAAHPQEAQRAVAARAWRRVPDGWRADRVGHPRLPDDDHQDATVPLGIGVGYHPIPKGRRWFGQLGARLASMLPSS